MSVHLCLLPNNYSNKKGETPIHCAAYNEVDSGELMELLMQICTEDIRQLSLQLRNADKVGDMCAIVCVCMYLAYDTYSI